MLGCLFCLWLLGCCGCGSFFLLLWLWLYWLLFCCVCLVLWFDICLRGVMVWVGLMGVGELGVESVVVDCCCFGGWCLWYCWYDWL